MNSKSAVFLDTSIQIERFVGPASNRQLIEQQLALPSFHAVTSHYVLMEFQRSVVADYVRVYNQILRFDLWHETAQALHLGAIARRPRALGRCLQILTEVMVQSQLDRTTALQLLQLEIKRNLLRRFWHHVTPLPDTIVCDLVVSGMPTHADTSFTVADTCRKERATCHLPSLLTDQRDRLLTLLDYLTAHPRSIKDQPRVEQRLRTALSDPRAALGQSACWPLGDLIIALQIPPNTALWTRDPDFAPLATALEIPLYQPPVIG